MAKKKNTTPKRTKADLEMEDKLLGNVMSDFEKARSYIREHYQGKWAKCFKAYNLIRTDMGYEGTANEFVPEIFSIVESLKANIAGSKPKFKYLPLREEQEQDTTPLNAYVDFVWSQNNMTKKMLGWVEDMVVYGNGVLMVSWENGLPMIHRIPLSDFYVDPTATHMNRPEEPGYPRYSGYRYLTSIDELKADKIIDPETGDMVAKYKNLDKIGNSSSADDSMDKDRKEQYIGSTLGKEAYSEQVEVIVHFTQNKMTMIANRDTIILEEDNPYQRDSYILPTTTYVDGEPVLGKQEVPEIKGFLPFAILRNYVDDNLFFARGDVEVALPTQEALNDVASQKRDNVAYALNNMWQIDPRFKHLAEQIKSAPGNVFPIPKGALTPIEKDDVSPSADNEIQRLTQQIRSATGADAAVQGLQQQFSRTTATEVQAQLNQASARFTTKVQTLEDEGFAQLARILCKMIQIFVNTEQMIRVVGKDGISWKTYEPNTYIGEYEPRVTLEATSKAEKMAVAQQLQAVMQFGLNNPLVNQQALLRQAFEHMLDDLSDDDIEELLNVPQPIMGPDGQAVDPALQQGDAMVTPEAAAMLRGEGGEQRSFNDTARGRATQTGSQGGGGADSGSNNIRRARSDQPSERLRASSKPS